MQMTYNKTKPLPFSTTTRQVRNGVIVDKSGSARILSRQELSDKMPVRAAPAPGVDIKEELF
jgi:hypothetical protein